MARRAIRETPIASPRSVVVVRPLPFWSQPTTTPSPLAPPSRDAISLAAQPPPRLASTAGLALPTQFAPMPDHSGRFVMRRREMSAFFDEAGFALSLQGGKDRGGFGLHARLVGARRGAPLAERAERGVVSSYVGAPSTWRAGAPIHGQLAWEEVYPGVDFVVEPSRGGFAYRFVLSPGADVRAIAMDWQGATEVRVVAEGRGLEIGTELGDLHVDGLRAFALEGNERRELGVRHVARDGRVGFELDGWNGDVPVVIDPAVSWGSYLGGAAGDSARDVAADGAGNVFVTGSTSSADFPSTGGFKTTLGGGTDVFVAKLSATGALAWSSYLGGSDQDDGYGIATDASGNLFVVGQTRSSDFPAAGGFDTTFAGSGAIVGGDAFVAKVTGAGALAWSSYLGGTTADRCNGVATDASGNALVTGFSYSCSRGPCSDAFVTKVTSAGARLWTTTFTGTNWEDARAVAVDAAGNVFVTGSTESTNFPSTGGFQTTLTLDPGASPYSTDAFVTKLSGAGAILWSSYLGGPNTDYGLGIACDASGNAFVSGQTYSSGFPGTTGARTDWFLTKVSGAGALLWSTYLKVGADVATDTSGNAFVVGGRDLAHLGAATDVVVTKVTGAGVVAWSSSFGGSGADYGEAIASDASGTLFLAGTTSSTDFPSAGGFQTTFRGGSTDAFVTILPKLGLANGSPCSFPGSCQSDSCVEGICCDQPCAGTCRACTAAKKGSGADGTCGFVQAGTDPSKNCPVAVCASNSTLAYAQVCDGAGACKSGGTLGCAADYACQSRPVGGSMIAECSTSCSGDASCRSATSYCVAPACVPKHAPGFACTAARECLSGSCVDGVCCDAPCTGACEACSAGKKGSGADGTCGAIANGTDPKLACPGVACVDATTVASPQVCDGAGACRANGTVSCGTFACKLGVCTTTCASDATCATGSYCLSNVCVPKLADGATCAAPRECLHGNCVDGVCCDKPCLGKCEACTGAKKGVGADGVCAAIAADRDPDSECAPGAGYPGNCAADGMCDGAGACRTFAAKGATCGAGASCTSLTGTVNACDGFGTCNLATVGCAPYACGTTACKTTCSSAVDCAPGAYCSSSGACIQTTATGTTCTTAAECTSGHCVDGVCCESKCDGQCQICNAAGSLGLCTFVTGAPHGARAACDGSGTCAGTCDGKAPGCTYPEAKTSCGAGCVAAKRASCDGKGACSEPLQCAFNFGCADPTSCATSCTKDTECAAGYACANQLCAPQASVCTADGDGRVPAGGAPVSCAPFKCSAGQCLSRCTDGSQCQSGNRCDANGACVPVSDAPAADGGGCATSAGPRGEGAGSIAALGLGLGLAAIGVRKRRGR